MNAGTSIQDQKSFYDERWREFSHINHPKLERCNAILEGVATTKLVQPQIVDLGSGTGWLTAILGAIGPAVGVELSPLAVAQAAQRYPTVKFIEADISRWDYPKASCDLVVSHEVLEHLEDQRAYLRVAHGLLRPGGFLILTTPNKPIVEIAYESKSKNEAEFQPIENWISRATLRSLLTPEFAVVRLTTILPGYCQRGKFRLLNAYLFRTLAERLGAGFVFNRLIGALGGGYHLFAVARKV